MFWFWKKLGNILITLFGVVTIIFFLFNILPGDPAQMMLGQNENSEQLLVLKKKYGFDKPILHQYFYYLNDVSPLSFHETKNEKSLNYLNVKKYNFTKIYDFKNTAVVFKFLYLRTSFVKTGVPVSKIISSTFFNTFFLACASIIFALIFGIFFGVISALSKDSLFDRLILYFSVIGMALPSFFSSIIVFGSKYFLNLLLIEIFFGRIFFRRLMVFFSFFLFLKFNI